MLEVRRYRLRSARGRISFAVHFWAFAVIHTYLYQNVCLCRQAGTDRCGDTLRTPEAGCLSKTGQALTCAGLASHMPQSWRQLEWVRRAMASRAAAACFKSPDGRGRRLQSLAAMQSAWLLGTRLLTDLLPRPRGMTGRTTCCDQLPGEELKERSHPAGACHVDLP